LSLREIMLLSGDWQREVGWRDGYQLAILSLRSLAVTMSFALFLGYKTHLRSERTAQIQTDEALKADLGRIQKELDANKR
jgi:hypothetical protein